jgi:hypothetical protein
MAENPIYKEHELKTWPKYFEAMWEGDKTFEYRKNDRGYKKGDIIVSQEWNPETKLYTGREIKAEISFVLENQMGVPDGYAILSLTNMYRYELKG